MYFAVVQLVDCLCASRLIGCSCASLATLQLSSSNVLRYLTAVGTAHGLFSTNMHGCSFYTYLRPTAGGCCDCLLFWLDANRLLGCEVPNQQRHGRYLWLGHGPGRSKLNVDKSEECKNVNRVQLACVPSELHVILAHVLAGPLITPAETLSLQPHEIVPWLLLSPTLVKEHPRIKNKACHERFFPWLCCVSSKSHVLTSI
jgi:hypothetical protein